MGKEITLLIGLPGSGKSYLIKQRFSNSTNYIVFDDFKAGAVLDCSSFCFSKHYPEIIGQIKLGGKHIIIADIDFCAADSYMEAKKILEWWIKGLKSNYKIKSIFFENDPLKCKSNLTRDNNRIFMVNNYTRFYSPNNMALKGDEILKVCGD